jgi:hypothetical protein
MKFRKRPVIVDAIRHYGSWPEIRDWLLEIAGDKYGGLAFAAGHGWDGNDNEIHMTTIPEPSTALLLGTLPPITKNEDGSLSIDTIEGVMLAQVGDWIIQGVEGELYPCKHSVFVATYERAPEKE